MYIIYIILDIVLEILKFGLIFILTIFFLLVLLIVYWLISENYKDKKYISYKKNNIGKKYLLYGRDKKAEIEGELKTLLPPDVAFIDLSWEREKIKDHPRTTRRYYMVKPNINKYDGIKRYIFEKMHNECSQITNKQKSPYICYIDQTGNIKAFSIRSYLYSKNEKEENLKKILEKFHIL